MKITVTVNKGKFDARWWHHTLAGKPMSSYVATTVPRANIEHAIMNGLYRTLSFAVKPEFSAGRLVYDFDYDALFDLAYANTVLNEPVVVHGEECTGLHLLLSCTAAVSKQEFAFELFRLLKREARFTVEAP